MSAKSPTWLLHECFAGHLRHGDGPGAVGRCTVIVYDASASPVNVNSTSVAPPVVTVTLAGTA